MLGGAPVRTAGLGAGPEARGWGGGRRPRRWDRYGLRGGARPRWASVPASRRRAPGALQSGGQTDRVDGLLAWCWVREASTYPWRELPAIGESGHRDPCVGPAPGPREAGVGGVPCLPARLRLATDFCSLHPVQMGGLCCLYFSIFFYFCRNVLIWGGCECLAVPSLSF